MLFKGAFVVILLLLLLDQRKILKFTILAELSNKEFQLKFRYSEKATLFGPIFHLYLT